MPSVGHDHRKLPELLDDFLAIREDRDGLTQIFGEYLAVLQRHGFNYDDTRGAELLAAALRALGNSERSPD